MRKTLRSGATETVRRRLAEASAGFVRAESPPSATGLEAELAELERLSLDDLAPSLAEQLGSARAGPSVSRPSLSRYGLSPSG